MMFQDTSKVKELIYTHLMNYIKQWIHIWTPYFMKALMLQNNELLLKLDQSWHILATGHQSQDHIYQRGFILDMTDLVMIDMLIN
eukprot:10706729-Ditylum_brightwellii.AAC.1